MISPKTILIPALLIGALSGCDTNPYSTTRLQSNPADLSTGVSSRAAQLSVVDQQAQSLNRLADEMVRKSTGKGAAIGGAIGCGLAIVSASSAKRCIAGAVAGATTGAMIGNAAGKRKVDRKIGAVSPEDLGKSLRDTSKKVSEIRGALPRILAEQDAELQHLHKRLAKKQISQSAYDDSVSRIRASRQALAQALTDSAAKAKASANNLGVASAGGQSGLMWHIGAALQLEDDATSARSEIKLF